MHVITILITDDHIMIRQSLASLFNSDARFRVVGQCSSGEAAVEAVRTIQPDIVIMDVNLPGMNGFEACKIISDDPGNSAKILGVSMNAEHKYASKMIQSGAMGYVTKNSPINELFNAVIEIFNNRRYICSGIKDLLCAEMLEGNDPVQQRSLTEREKKLIDLLKQGLTSKEIALLFDRSVKTIQTQRHNLMKKLQLSNVAALINYASKLVG